MKINQKIYSLLTIVSGIATIIIAVLSFQHVVGIDMLMLSLGITQLFGGLSQLQLAKSADSKELNKISKGVGIFSITIGLIIILTILIKNIAY